MVKSDYFRTMSEREISQCKFDFCRDCPFYECELVGEYEQFRENHAQDQDNEPLGIATFVDGSYAGTVVSIRSAEQEDNDSVTHSELDDAHSRSFDTDIVSYDQSKMQDHCIMNRSVYQVECGRKKVTEGIGDHYKIEIDDDGNIKKGIEDKWEPLQPVFISAQTGQGKNYFIEKELIPYVRQLDYDNQRQQKVLILSNRLALKQQIKNRIDGNKIDGNDDDLCDEEEKVLYSYRAFADVMTYQGLLLMEGYLKRRQRNADSRYIYVICDEAHFFTSDAMFNPHTQKILSAIIRLFHDAIRVYMSATPYECLEYIIKYEEEFQKNCLNLNKPQNKWEIGQMVFYHFKRDYGYLDVKIYSTIEELYGEIVNSVSIRREKWLIFIDDKMKCRSVKEQLEKFAKDNQCPLMGENDESKEKVFVVDADSKKESIYQEIVRNERLNNDTYVLISTSVLDNGVNLAGIKNIVVSDMEKEKCLQMLGRARVKRDDDRKTLYIKRFSEDEVDKRINDSKRQQDAYNSYEMAYDELRDISYPRGEYTFLSKYYNGKASDWENAKRWFGVSYKNRFVKYYLNEIAKSLLDRRLPCYECIRDEMDDENSKEDEQQNGKKHIGQKYLEYQLSWFGKVYCEDNDITFLDKEKAKKEFIDFLESYAKNSKKIVDTGKTSPFRKEFTRLYDIAFGRKEPNKKRIYSITKMNSLLEDVNVSYKVVTYTSHWIIEECDWEREDSE